MGVSEGSRDAVGGGVAVRVGGGVGSSTVFRVSPGVGLAVREGWYVSLGRTVGETVGAVKKNGWQAERKTTRNDNTLG
jgi:hypothetical protein